MSLGRRPLAFLVVAISLATLTWAARAETRIGVLYPESAAPYLKLYQTIISGMALAGDVQLRSRAVSDRDSAEDVRNWLMSSQVTVALGELPPALTGSLAMPLVHGAGALNDNSLSGVSLAASPAQMFKRLRQIAPDVERVFVVYRPQATGWLIAAGKVAAREQGLELIIIACDDVQQASAAFGRMLPQTRPGEDAIWLTLDPVVPLNQLLPVLLRESWDRNLILFSNNPIDVAKGALFALYPDYPAMGKQLAERAKKQATKSAATGPEASEHLNAAVNTRTAAHLGIVLGERQLQAFERIFPEAPK